MLAKESVAFGIGWKQPRSSRRRELGAATSII
jgi:hypothetical protein